MFTVELPSEQIHVGTREPIRQGNLMEFRLLYEGELPSCSNANRHPKEKHAIRRAIHPQLRRLWQTRSNLRQLADRYFVQGIDNPAAIGSLRKVPEVNDIDLTDEQRFELGTSFIGNKFNRAGYDIIPLVTEELVLRCSLDILLLRPTEKKLILRQGDIDGQVKTLFDALRMPSDAGETGGTAPSTDDNPLYCLLEDDRLISEVKVTADELLLLPSHREVSANDSVVVINVRLNHRDPRTFDNYFG